MKMLDARISLTNEAGAEPQAVAEVILLGACAETLRRLFIGSDEGVAAACHDAAQSSRYFERVLKIYQSHEHKSRVMRRWRFSSC